MDITLILIRTGAILLAVGAGWCLGRANPSWRIDRANENMPRYHYGYSHGGMGCVYLGGFFNGAWGVVILGVLALVLCFMGWQDPVINEISPHTGGEVLLFTKPFWIMVGALAAGYIPSRLTDKGPVGPLE